MAKKEYRIKVDRTNRKPVRDELVKNMITTTGGTARVFPDKKRARKADKVGRKQKYKGAE